MTTATKTNTGTNAGSNTATSAGAANAQAATQSVTRVMEDAVRGWGRAMESWLDAQHRMMTAAMTAMPAMPPDATRGFEQMIPDVAGTRQTAERMNDQVRQSANRVFHGSVDLSTANVSDMASVLNEQARFMGRLADRAADCVLGEHAARTPEAYAATVRTMLADCVENAAMTSEQMVRLGTRSVETVRAMVEHESADVAKSTPGH